MKPAIEDAELIRRWGFLTTEDADYPERVGLVAVSRIGTALDDEGVRRRWQSGDYVDPELLRRCEQERA